MATLQESVLAPACVSSVAFRLPSVAPVWIKMKNIFLHGHQTSAAAAAASIIFPSLCVQDVETCSANKTKTNQKENVHTGHMK